MDYAMPPSMSGSVVRLEEFDAGQPGDLADAIAVDDLWRSWYTHIPSPQAMPGEIERRRELQAQERMAPWAVIDTRLGRAEPTAPSLLSNFAMELAELVEDLMAYVPLPPSGSRRWSGQACLNFQPGPIRAFANVSALRATASSLQQVSIEASRFFDSCGRQDFLWFLGPLSRPIDAADVLIQLGADSLGQCAAMLLEQEPPATPGVDIRPVTTAEHLLAYRRIGAVADTHGGLTPPQEQELQMSNESAWRDYTSYAGSRLNFLAYLQNDPVAAAGLLLTDHGVAVLSGGATLPAARGQGLYRALVHARWMAAKRRSAGPLAVQASPMSRPVLTQLGFQVLASMMILTQPVVPR